MYAIFNPEGHIVRVAVKEFEFACVFCNQVEAYKVLLKLDNPETLEIKPIKVY